MNVIENLLFRSESETAIRIILDERLSNFQNLSYICSYLAYITKRGALRDLVAFSQFKKREKHPWRSVNTPPWVFFTFFKLYKCYQTAQRITYGIQLLVMILCKKE